MSFVKEDETLLRLVQIGRRQETLGHSVLCQNSQFVVIVDKDDGFLLRIRSYVELFLRSLDVAILQNLGTDVYYDLDRVTLGTSNKINESRRRSRSQGRPLSPERGFPSAAGSEAQMHWYAASLGGPDAWW